MHPGVDFQGGKMPTGSVQGIYNGNSLRGQTKTLFADLPGKMFRGASHCLIITYCNKKFLRE